MKTTKWQCDTCGQTIEDASHGWVEWLTNLENEKRSCKGLRIVHSYPNSPHAGSHRCQYDGQLEFQKNGSIVSDIHLDSFTGHDGLTKLLSMLDGDGFSNREVIEVIQRIHTPGYEEARHSFDAALDDFVFEPNTKPNYYRQAEIKAVLDWASSEQES